MHPLVGRDRARLRRCDFQVRDIPFYLQDFTDRYEARYHDVQLPLPMPGLHVVI